MSDRLRIQLQGEVTLGQLKDVAGTLRDLVTEVAGDVPGAGKDAVQWVISDASAGSLTLELKARAKKEGVAASVVEDVVSSVAKGLAVVQARPERPRYFNDAALERAKDLAELMKAGITGLRVGDTVDKEVGVTSQLIANIDVLIGPRMESIGTVEGTLESITIHGRQIFAVYDAISGRRYECSFGDQIPLADVIAAFGKRIAARGVIRSRRGGGKSSVEVSRLRVFEAEEDLPSADSVKGILRGGD